MRSHGSIASPLFLAYTQSLPDCRGHCHCLQAGLCSSQSTEHGGKSTLNLLVTTRLPQKSLASQHSEFWEICSQREQWHAGTHSTTPSSASGVPYSRYSRNGSGSFSRTYRGRPTVCFTHGRPHCSVLSYSAFPLGLSLILPCFLWSSFIRLCLLCVFHPDVTLPLTLSGVCPG